jgi:shikimate kinase
MNKIIFIIGPGGVGKTTCGRILAEKLHYDFIDLDDEFISQIGDISGVICKEGYERYFQLNSWLFLKITASINKSTVFVLSSGFLTYNEHLTSVHLKAITDQGVSVLLLPSEDIEKAVEIIVNRQLNRGFGLVRENEENKIRKRFFVYKNYGNIKIFSDSKPEDIVSKIIAYLPE